MTMSEAWDDFQQRLHGATSEPATAPAPTLDPEQELEKLEARARVLREKINRRKQMQARVDRAMDASLDAADRDGYCRALLELTALTYSHLLSAGWEPRKAVEAANESAATLLAGFEANIDRWTAHRERNEERNEERESA